MKATAIAHPNIALIKYWGKRDDRLNLPMNPSLSLTLGGLSTKTTVEFSEKLQKDYIEINGEIAAGEKHSRAKRHLDLIRERAGIRMAARVASRNDFPTAAGLASSASGFAALTVAGCAAAGLRLGARELSAIARLGSGSACRSLYGGFVEWKRGRSERSSYAVQVADEHHWNVRDVIAIVEPGEKRVSSTRGMQMTVRTSPYYGGWLRTVRRQLAEMRRAIMARDFRRMGKLAELNSFMMHALMMTTSPPLMYWVPGTMAVIHEVERMRRDGLDAYCTIDAGPNVHVLCLPKDEREVAERLGRIHFVEKTIASGPGPGPRLTAEHLF